MCPASVERPRQVNRSMPPGTIIPELAYHDVVAAARWLVTAFGFRERLRIGNHRIQLVYGEAAVVATDGLAGSDGPGLGMNSHSLMVRVDDVDAHHQRVSGIGGRILSAPQTFPFGERQYTVEDPGGHRWTFTQSVADVDPGDWGGQAIDLG